MLILAGLLVLGVGALVFFLLVRSESESSDLPLRPLWDLLVMLSGVGLL
jgi:hypothetical protein